MAESRWAIVIQGRGRHHEPGAPDTDANIMAANLVTALRAQGNAVYNAAFLAGESEVVTDDETYILNLRASQGGGGQGGGKGG